MNKWSFGLIILLGAGLVGTALWAKGVRAEQTEQERLADSLAAEVAAERLRAEGMAVEFGEEVDSLALLMMEKDSSLANTARELTAARARIIALGEIVASAEGQIIVDTVEVVANDSTTEYRGNAMDGILHLDWIFRVPPGSMNLSYRVLIPGNLFQWNTNDGRIWVGIDSEDPRVAFNVENLWVQPLEPQIRYQLSWSQAGIATGIGLIIGMLIK